MLWGPTLGIKYVGPNACSHVSESLRDAMTRMKLRCQKFCRVPCTTERQPDYFPWLPFLWCLQACRYVACKCSLGLQALLFADIRAVTSFCGHEKKILYDAHGNNRQNKLMYSREPLTHTTNVSIHFGKTVNRQNDTSSLRFFVT
jgi:hypothetical protein